MWFKNSEMSLLFISPKPHNLYFTEIFSLFVMIKLKSDSSRYIGCELFHLSIFPKHRKVSENQTFILFI